MKRYGLRRSAGAPAEVIGPELERISHVHGGLTATVVVTEAKPPDAPLHPCFTWDDATAATEYRLWEARNLIRSVYVIEDGEDKGAEYALVRAEGESGVYMPTAAVVQDEELLAAAIEHLKKNLIGAEKGLCDLQKRAEQKGDRRRVKYLVSATQHVGLARDSLAKANNHG